MMLEVSKSWRWLKILFLCGLVIYLLFFLYNACISIVHPYQIDYAEGISLDRVRKLSRGISIYIDISTYPHICCQYTPVAYILYTGLAKIFGASLALGRSASLVTSILVGALIYGIVKENTRDRYIALISSLLFFASPFAYFQAHVFGDIMTLGILFSLIGIYLITRYERTKRVYFCVPFFLLAVYTKQTFIAAPIASFIYLFAKDRKLTIKIAGLYVLSGLCLFLLANHLTEGRFYFHTLASNLFPYTIFNLVFRYVKTIQLHFILLSFAGAFALHAVIRRQSNIFVIYFVISAIIAITAGKVGASAISYMLELIAVSCILFGFCFAGVQQQIRESELANTLVGVALIFQLVVFAHVPYFADSIFRGSTTPTMTDRINGQKVSSYVKNTTGKVLSQDAGFVVLNNKELLVDLFLFTQLYRKDLVDQSELVSDIQNKEFSLILLKFDVKKAERSDCLTDEMLNAARNSYHLVETIGGNYIYEPNL